MTADRWSGQNEKKYRKEKMLKKFTEGNLPSKLASRDDFKLNL